MNNTAAHRSVAAAVILLFVGTACAAHEQTNASDRAVAIRTTGCGDASRTAGAGVIVDRGFVLTAAHVVVGSTEVFVSHNSEESAVVVVLDRTRDLALLSVPSIEASPVELVELEPGDSARIVGAQSSPVIDATVERRLMIDVDDVRGSSRSDRAGYELDTAIVGGDSGAGVYDRADRLAGIVFAIPTERSDATFVVGSAEIEAVWVASDRAEHRCDDQLSQLVRSDPTSSGS